MKKIYFSMAVLAALTSLSSCKKDADPIAAVDTTLNASVITEFSTNVAQPEYATLSAKTALLYTQAQTLSTARTDQNLQACRTTWLAARQVWEQSEAQLFGPVETDDIDPHIDTWPVDFNALNAQLAGSQEFTDDYINNLDDALKGFHPIEYILFGKSGKKAASALTDREILYLLALTQNVKTLTANLNTVWDSSISTSFYNQFTTAGTGSTTYTTQEAALEQMVKAMMDICDEVANGKMKEPYEAQDSTLEESPFAKTSMTDFINNITGIQNVYLGKYQTDGKGLEDIVKQYNLSLDAEVKLKLSTALAAMGNVNEAYGKAIYNQHVQIESAMAAINDLHDSLENDLLPFIKVHAK